MVSTSVDPQRATAIALSGVAVLVASMLAVGGLGQMVLRGIGRLDMGLATIGGLGIVIMAIVLDRMTQAFSQKQKRGPGATLLSFLRRKKVAAPVTQETDGKAASA